LTNAPLMRALRPCKLTIAALESACRNYLDEDRLLQNNPTFAMLNKSSEISKKNARKLLSFLKKENIDAALIVGEGQSGGGTLPDVIIPTTAVEIRVSIPELINSKDFYDTVFSEMMQDAMPVIGVMRKGCLVFETLTVTEDECEIIAKVLRRTINKVIEEKMHGTER